jgi:hypothetical protein
LNPFRHRQAADFGSREKMNVIGHQDITADPPAIANRSSPDRSQDFVALSVVQDRFPSIGAGGKENDRVIAVGRNVSEMTPGGPRENNSRA